jgi:poly(3-hydroxybutyrate) depolymerase
MGPFLGKDVYLPSFGADPDSVTISGISGGSYTANQLHVVYSDLIKGAGLIIGGPYGDDITYSFENHFDVSQDNTAKVGIQKAEMYHQ